MQSEYLLVLLATLFFPFILSRDKHLALYRHKAALLATIAAVSVPFWVWDIVVTARGHWWFNTEYTLGVEFAGLPVEEWMFFPVIAFVSVFTWESVKYFMEKKR